MAQELKLVSWNVNGIRAALKKGFLAFIEQENPDIICLQEMKANQEQVEFELPGYKQFWNSAKRKGYSGTAIFSKLEPIRVTLWEKELADKYGSANQEGRVITAEYKDFFLVNVYTPNAKRDLSRVDFRHDAWDVEFLKYLKELEKTKPVVFCGDLNVAHEEIDLARPDTNHNTHGFTDKEREGFSKFVEAGFLDTFRHLFPEKSGAYTWWSAFGGARSRNVGWRIDYFLVSKSLISKLKSAFIRSEILGSDHCPVGITLEV